MALTINNPLGQYVRLLLFPSWPQPVLPLLLKVCLALLVHPLSSPLVALIGSPAGSHNGSLSSPPPAHPDVTHGSDDALPEDDTAPALSWRTSSQRRIPRATTTTGSCASTTTFLALQLATRRNLSTFNTHVVDKTEELRTLDELAVISAT